MDTWEYLSEITYANNENGGWKEYRDKTWPGFNPPKFAPQTMIPFLNSRARDGWELVSMQPVAVGGNLDVLTHCPNSVYTNAYFCVFKRRIGPKIGTGQS